MELELPMFQAKPRGHITEEIRELDHGVKWDGEGRESAWMAVSTTESLFVQSPSVF